MPETITENLPSELATDQTDGGTNGGGLGDWKFYGGDDSSPQPREPERTPPPEGYRIAIWMTLVGVAALFLALIVMYVWVDARRAVLPTPRLFWLSTGLVLLCSVSLEGARRALRRRAELAFQRWLWITMGVALAFLITQSIALWQLSQAGFFAARNLRSWLAFFITGSHAAHVVGGLIGLSYLIVKNRYGDWTALRRRVTLDSTILYWHFIDGLWLLLFALIFLWH